MSFVSNSHISELFQQFLKEQLEASLPARSLFVAMYAERHTIVPVMFYKAAKLTLSDEM